MPTCAILTCPPNELMAAIHDRMPVIVPAAACNRWLDPSTSTVDLQSLLVPLPSEEMEAYEVSTFVNSPQNDSPESSELLTDRGTHTATRVDLDRPTKLPESIAQR